MADISKELQDILKAVYGEEVRGSIHDAIELINLVCDATLTTGTAVTETGSSVEGFYKGSLYINTETCDLWKCTGNAWAFLTNLIGNGISGIEKTFTTGFTDTYTISFTDGTTFPFTVTNGKGIISVLKTETSVLTDTYRITYNDGTYTDYNVVNGNGISGIQKTGTNVLTDTYTISFTNGTSTTFTVTNGTGITRIEKTATVGLTDTYTVYLSDGTSANFTVKNGVGLSGFEKNSSGLVDTYTLYKNDGTTYSFSVTNGKGIQSHVKQGTSGLIDTYRITYNDGTHYDYTVTNGKGISSFVLTDDTTLAKVYTITYNDGTTQEITITDGKGISGIAKTGTTDLTDTYTITFTDGTTQTYTVKNGFSPSVAVNKAGKIATITITDETGPHTVQIRDGEDGEGSGDMLKQTYDTDDNGIVDRAEAVDWDGVENVPYDTVPTAQSDKLMKSRDIKAAIDGKGDTLVYDDAESKLKLYSGGEQGTLLSVVEIEGGGGSIKLGDVSGAAASSHMNSVSLTWTDPSDIIVDGTPLAAWSGTLVVRKAGSAPQSRNDGTVVVDSKTRNQYSSTPFTDDTVEYGTTYYYRFFPYTTGGSYTNGSSVSVTPSRIEVSIPVQSGTLTYDGTLKTASFTGYDSTKMSVTGDTGTNAGTYTARFSLNSGYCWPGGSIADQEVTWTIGNAVISTVPSISSSLIYTGNVITPIWEDYDTDELTIGGDTSGTNVGNYATTFTPNTNYEWWDGTRAAKTVQWAIVYESIEHVPVQTGSLTYDGTSQAPTWLYFDDTKMTKTETAQTNAGTYTTIFTPLTGYSWPDHSTEPKSISWTIAKATLTIPTLNGYSLTYDGTAKSVTFSNFDSTKMTKSGDSAINAGNHTALIGISDKVNYEWTDHTVADQSFTWTIAKATLTIPTPGTETLTYTGSEQTRNFNYYSSSTMSVTGNTGTNAGTYTATFALLDDDNYQWYGGTTADQDVTWTIAKAAASITPQESSVTLDTDHQSVQLGITIVGEGTVTALSSDTSVATATMSGNYIVTIASVNETTGTATVTLSMEATTNYLAANATISVTASFAQIYGVEWDGTSTTAWSRTDAAAGFTDPVPAVNNGTGSSPFDTISPWKDIKRVTDQVGGELVEIPKFYYKLSKTGNTMKLQISSSYFDGASVSPAHMDRGDGKGERDVVYIGRYHCASDFKSKTGVQPHGNITRDAFRTGIRNLGAGYWQNDYALRITLWLLYLVEFADWNSQAKIGYGCSPSGSKANMGGTDAMQYHTGTSAANRTTYGWTQYRYIEGLWDNVYDWCDGVYFSDTNIYAILNPADFSDTTGGTLVGTRPDSSNYISAFAKSSVQGFEWFMYPSAVSGSDSTYVCDYCSYDASGVVLYVGGYCSQNQGRGLFFLYGNYAASSKGSNIGSRLQKLP